MIFVHIVYGFSIMDSWSQAFDVALLTTDICLSTPSTTNAPLSIIILPSLIYTCRARQTHQMPGKTITAPMTTIDQFMLAEEYVSDCDKWPFMKVEVFENIGAVKLERREYVPMFGMFTGTYIGKLNDMISFGKKRTNRRRNHLQEHHDHQCRPHHAQHINSPPEFSQVEIFVAWQNFPPPHKQCDDRNHISQLNANSPTAHDRLKGQIATQDEESQYEHEKYDE